jgi:hypothetical protein
MTVSPRIRLIAFVGVLAAAAMAGGMLLLPRTPEAVASAPLPHHAVAKPKPAAKQKPAKHATPHGLPAALEAQLIRHRVVVAALYAGGAAVDRIARDEARAGAADARVGFVALDVSNRRVALALAEKADAVAAPAVLVFRRGGAVEARLDGFADRQLVAGLAESGR